MRAALSAFFAALILSTVSVAQTEVAPVEQGPGGLPAPEQSEELPQEGDAAPQPSELPELESPENNLPIVVQPALVSTSCKLLGDTVLALGFTESEKQNDIATIRYKGCTLELSDDGTLTSRMAIEVLLNVNADVSRCSTLQMSMLLALSTDDDALRWEGARVPITDLIVENIEGDKRDIGHFVFHDNPPDKMTLLKDVIFPPSASPSYPDIFWGTATILQEDATGPLAGAIRRLTPVVHSRPDDPATMDEPDLTVELTVEPYLPRAWCRYTDAASETQTVVLTAASPAK